MRRLQLGLVVAEMASRERGPSNGVLGAAQPGAPEGIARLVKARDRTDAAFDALQKALSDTVVARPAVAGLVKQARERLQLARADVDTTAAKPLAQRQAGDVSQAVANMFAVIDALEQPTAMLLNEALSAYPAVGDPLTAARLAAELREYAGQLGSQFTVALTTRQPLRDVERVAIERLRGRIEQLHKLLAIRTQGHQERPSVQMAMTAMQSRYFQTAIPLVESLVQIGTAGGQYGIDTATFAARYVPDMDSIVDLRNVLMDTALSHAAQEQSRAQTALAIVLALCALTVATLVLTLWVVRNRVVQRISKITALIVGLAQGDLERTVPTSRSKDEVADMLRAIGVLKEHGLARRQLETERQQLIDQLRDQSNTDFLTDLPNRRGFFSMASLVFANLRRHRLPASLMLLDVDHFKRVNDTHGHAAGDAVLIEVGKRCRALCRAGDVVARYGGEEFLILMPQCDFANAMLRAEALRRDIEAAPVTMPEGQALQITASFGVSPCLDSDGSIEDVIERADDLLYEAKHRGRNQVVGAPGSPPELPQA